MRIEAVGGPDFSSPHIFARKIDEAYVFELWVERGCVLSNLGLASSICAFLHLAFCFSLNYPKVCFYVSCQVLHQSLQESETACDFLQRVVAEYGNDDGTKTSKSTGTAAGKLLKYQVQLGKILGAREAEKSD